MSFNGSLEGQAIAEHVKSRLEGRDCSVSCRGNKTHYKITIESTLSDPAGVRIGVIGVIRVSQKLLLQHMEDDGDSSTAPVVIDSKELELADESCIDELDKFLGSLTPEVSTQRVMAACERLKKSLSVEQQLAVEAIQRVTTSAATIDSLNKIIEDLKSETKRAKEHCKEKCESKVLCMCAVVVESSILACIIILYMLRNILG